MVVRGNPSEQTAFLAEALDTHFQYPDFLATARHRTDDIRMLIDGGGETQPTVPPADSAIDEPPTTTASGIASIPTCRSGHSITASDNPLRARSVALQIGRKCRSRAYADRVTQMRGAVGMWRFHVAIARASRGGPVTVIRPLRRADDHESAPRCQSTNATDSASTCRSGVPPGSA